MIHESRFERRTRGLVHGPALLFSSDTLGLHLSLRPWRGGLVADDPVGNATLVRRSPLLRTWKIVVRAREGGENVWTRAFRSSLDASIVWCRLVDVDRWSVAGFPTSWTDGELEYLFATVDTFTSVGTTSWAPQGERAPASVDYLCVGGGGGGGFNQGGGGGAGGYRAATGHAAGIGMTVTVGSGGGGGVSAVDPLGRNGSSSVFDDVTSNGGGGGGGQAIDAPTGTFGSGGGGGGGIPGSAAASGTAGQGNGGGAGQSGGNLRGGGGGGAGGAGVAGSSTGNGGTTSSSAISGSSVAYAGGGGGGCNAGSPGTGGGGGAGNGSQTATGGNASGSKGSGGGGGGNNAGTAFAGGSGDQGIVILSYTALNAAFPFDLHRFRHMLVR